MRILGRHYTCLQAPSEAALDRSIAEWRSRFEAELVELRLHPEGRLVTTRHCCGTSLVQNLPAWLPAPFVNPSELVFRFVEQKIPGETTWTAHLCAELLHRAMTEDRDQS